jgi:hypothetical protein
MKFVTSDFLWLTSRTYPYGSENSKHLTEKLMNEYGFKYDDHGNLFRVILKDDNVAPTTMFCAHTDTVLDTRWYRFCKKRKWAFGKSKPVKHVFPKHNKDMVRTDGTTTLGADDKAGVAIILRMITKQKPGVYYLFIGEEVGHVGSRSLKNFFFENRELKNVTKCISLDRRGYDSVVTHQTHKRTCSDKFAGSVSKKLNSKGFFFRPDPTGASTDSLEFIAHIPECTNLSVGYFKAHTNREVQDLRFLEDLCDAMLSINWELIPASRKLTEKNPTNDYNYLKIKQSMNL